MDEKIPIQYDKGIRDSRVDLSFLSSIKFENMLKRRRLLMRNMNGIVKNEDSNLIDAIDRIIELSSLTSSK